MELDPSGSDVVEGKSDCCCHSGCDSEGEWLNEIPLSEPGIETLLEVVVRPSDADVVNQVSEHVDLESLESFAGSPELRKRLEG